MHVQGEHLFQMLALHMHHGIRDSVHGTQRLSTYFAAQRQASAWHPSAAVRPQPGLPFEPEQCESAAELLASLVLLENEQN